MRLGPDEPAHIERAAATARLEIPNYRSEDARVGAAFMTPVWLPKDYAFWGDQTEHIYHRAPKPRCHGTWPDSCQILTATYQGAYSPAYYLLVGWPSLILTYPAGAYGMRLASALLSALLLASAVRTAAESSRGRRLPVLGVLAAATPSALFTAGMVNPSAAEVAGAVLTWSVLLALALDPDPALLRRRLLRLVIGGSLLMTARTLGPFWVFAALATVGCAALLARRSVGPLLTRRSAGSLLTAIRRPGRPVLAAAGALAAAGVAALAWDAYAGGTSVADPSVRHIGLLAAARSIAGSTWFYARQEFGQFGWGYQISPTPIVVAGIAMVLVLVVLALRLAGRAQALLLAAAVVTAIFVGIPLNAPDYSNLTWIGRYQLPFVVGVPLLAAWLAERGGAARGWELGPRTSRLAAWLPGVFAALMAVSMGGFFYAIVHQYRSGNLMPFPSVKAPWSPSITWHGAALLFAVGVAALCLTAVTSPRRSVAERAVVPGPRAPYADPELADSVS